MLEPQHGAERQCSSGGARGRGAGRPPSRSGAGSPAPGDMMSRAFRPCSHPQGCFVFRVPATGRRATGGVYRGGLVRRPERNTGRSYGTTSNGRDRGRSCVGRRGLCCSPGSGGAARRRPPRARSTRSPFGSVAGARSRGGAATLVGGAGGSSVGPDGGMRRYRPAEAIRPHGRKRRTVLSGSKRAKRC